MTSSFLSSTSITVQILYCMVWAVMRTNSDSSSSRYMLEVMAWLTSLN